MASLAADRSSLAETISTGITRLMPRMRRSVSMPSMSGIRMSSRIASGLSRVRLSNASAPLTAVTTSSP